VISIRSVIVCLLTSAITYALWRCAAFCHSKSAVLGPYAQSAYEMAYRSS
jgi:hypothetical protein